MARRRNYTTRNANRALERLHHKGSECAVEIARFVVEYIATNKTVVNPNGTLGTPYDDTDPRGQEKPENMHLRNSYYVRLDPATGDALIKCRRRYWAFVEFGTRR